jgi:hypothetical protein
MIWRDHPRDIDYVILKTNGFETADEVVFVHHGDLKLEVGAYSKNSVCR